MKREYWPQTSVDKLGLETSHYGVDHSRLVRKTSPQLFACPGSIMPHEDDCLIADDAPLGTHRALDPVKDKKKI